MIALEFLVFPATARYADPMKLYPELNDKLIAFIQKQKMFFVATAPLMGGGHIDGLPGFVRPG